MPFEANPSELLEGVSLVPIRRLSKDMVGCIAAIDWPQGCCRCEIGWRAVGR